MRLVLGGTTGDTDSYTLAITKRRADIGQGILRTDIKRRAAIGHLVGKVGRAWRVGAGFQFERFGRLEPFTIISLAPRNIWGFRCSAGCRKTYSGRNSRNVVSDMQGASTDPE